VQQILRYSLRRNFTVSSLDSHSFFKYSSLSGSKSFRSCCLLVLEALLRKPFCYLHTASSRMHVNWFPDFLNDHWCFYDLLVYRLGFSDDGRLDCFFVNDWLDLFNYLLFFSVSIRIGVFSTLNLSASRNSVVFCSDGAGVYTPLVTVGNTSGGSCF